LAAALVSAAARVHAHHAFAAEYDEKKVVSVSGTVTRFTWTNPHAWLYIDGRDEQGRITKWQFEMGSPGGLQHRGWKRAELKQGDAVTIDGFASRTRVNVANARNVTLPDGRTLFGGFASTPGNPAK
jgi:hypothetical protein